MKKWMRKLCGSSLVLVLVLGMLTSVTVLAKGEPSVTVTGIPTVEVQAGDAVELQIKVDGVEGYTDLRYTLEGPFGDAGFVNGDIGEDGTATISTTIMETTRSSEECELYVSALDENGERVFGICNQEFTLYIVQPKLTIVSGVPQGEIYAASPITVQVKAENLDPNEKYFVSVSGLSGSEEVDITDGQTVEVSGKVSPFDDEDSYFEIWLYQVTGEGEWDYEEVCRLESSHYQTKAKVELTDLKWNPIKEAVAGTAYPFSVTVRNLIDEDIPDLAIEAGASAHVLEGWRSEISYALQDGVSASGRTAYIANLKAGEAVTIEGTITFPANAVGDGSYLSVSLIEDNDYIAYLATNEQENGVFQIVAAGSGTKPSEGNGGQGTDTTNTNGQNTNTQNANTQNANGQTAKTDAASSTVKTGDTAPLMATVAVMLVSVCAIAVVIRRRQMN